MQKQRKHGQHVITFYKKATYVNVLRRNRRFTYDFFGSIVIDDDFTDSSVNDVHFTTNLALLAYIIAWIVRDIDVGELFL